MQKEQFDITGMTCSACSTRVEKSVAKLPGIKEVSVNLLKNSMVASYDESVLDTAGIVQAVEKAGYGAIPKASAQNKSRTTTPAAKPEVSTAQVEYKQMKQRLLLSALFTIPLFYISMGHMMGWPLPSSLLGMLQIAASLEKLSEHPLADAIVAEAEKAQLSFLPVDDFKQIPGQGLVGQIGNETCLAGNRRLMAANGINGGALLQLGEEMAVDGKTPLFFARGGQLIGVIAVADVVKKGDIVHKLKIARGQLDGILQMVEENRYCVDISNQLLATQALLKSANQQILQAHIRSCVRDALQTDAVNPKLEEALKLLEKMIQ